MRSWEGHWDAGESRHAEVFNEIGVEDAAEILEASGFQPTEPPEVVRRDKNRSFFAETSRGPFVLKVFRYDTNQFESLQEEAELVQKLADGGLPLVAAQPLPGNVLVGTWCGQLFSIYPRAEATKTRSIEISTIDFAEIGQIIARFHCGASTQQLTHRLTYTPDTWGVAALDYIEQHQVAPAALRNQFADTAHRFIEHAIATWPETPLVPIHSDLDPSNFLWIDGRHPVIIDFEELGFGSPVHDTFRLPHGLAKKELCSKADAEIYRRRLEAGYRELATLPDETAGLTATIRGMRLLAHQCSMHARRHDRHYGGTRLTAHTKAHWRQQIDRLERYRSIR